MHRLRLPGRLAALVALAAMMAPAALAETAAPPPDLAARLEEQTMLLNTVWVMVAAFLVFFMQAGFACVEGGLTRAKNANNIMMKNLMDFSIGTLAFWAIGFGIMFGAGNGFMGTEGFFLTEKSKDTFGSLSWTNVPLFAKFMFQLVFAATAATIVSGAMAERTKFTAYLGYSALVSLIIYPIVGHWIWGGGWLAKMGFWDFAGSTVVHSTGGWLALTGALVLGPRLGKYGRDGRINALPGHSLPMAALGVFILWLGWFGFNPGSTMAATTSIAHIATTTNIAAATGALAAMLLAWVMLGKPDVSMTLNGALAGLVVITAPCAFVSPVSAAIIGLCGGLAVVMAVLFFDRIKIDDPVGAISVHGVCGALGTVLLGLFAEDRWSPGTTGNGLLFGGGAKLLMAQLTGVGVVALWCVATGLVLFLALKYTLGVRVSEREEREGLDISEHGNPAYPEFEHILGAAPGVTPTARPAPASSPLRAAEEGT